MMRNSVRYIVVALVFSMGLLACGCGKTRGGNTGGITGAEIVEPDVLPGDYALGDDRFEDIGHPITGPAVEFGVVLFGYDSYNVHPAEIPKIEKAADYLRRNRRVVMVTEGHCDERGSREYNMSLGENRALAVRAYLIRLGVEDARIQTRSMGEEKPVDPGHNEAAWRRNRRVELSVYALD